MLISRVQLCTVLLQQIKSNLNLSPCYVGDNGREEEMSPVRFQGKEFVPAPSPTRWRLVVSLKLRHLFLLTFIAAYFMSWHNVTCCEFGDFFILTFFRTIKTITALHTYWSVTRCRVGKSGPLEESHGEEGPRSDSDNAAVNIYPWSWSFCRVRLISPGACWEKTSLRLQISGDQAAWRMRFWLCLMQHTGCV